MNGIEVWGKHVSVVVASLSLNDGDDSFKSHSRVDILLRKRLQLTARFSVEITSTKGG